MDVGPQCADGAIQKDRVGGAAVVLSEVRETCQVDNQILEEVGCLESDAGASAAFLAEGHGLCDGAAAEYENRGNDGKKGCFPHTT